MQSFSHTALLKELLYHPLDFPSQEDKLLPSQPLSYFTSFYFSISTRRHHDCHAGLAYISSKSRSANRSPAHHVNGSRLQIIFSVIALGLSVSLINGQLAWTGSAPSQTDFAAFCGGWGILIALVGCAALFVEALQGMIITILDASAVLVSFVGGIVRLPFSPSPHLSRTLLPPPPHTYISNPH
jgi:hypothetical protein